MPSEIFTIVNVHTLQGNSLSFYIAIAIQLSVKYLLSTYHVLSDHLGPVYFYCHIYFYNYPFKFTPFPNQLYSIFQ